VLVGDIKQLLVVVQLIMGELMHQGTTRRAELERRDDVGIGHPQELMALLGEAPSVISERFIRLLSATP
jgi:hypothetical protein